VIFRTKSGRDGLFRLVISPGKYQVETGAEGYLRFLYVVDLRSAVAVEPLDAALQTVSECHDIRVTSSQDTEATCSSEALLPNLILRTATTIGGYVKDETGAPFKNSEVVLRKVSAIPHQPGSLFAKTTDADGGFGFAEAEPGSTGYWPRRVVRLPNPQSSTVMRGETAILKSYLEPTAPISRTQLALCDE
jgi:hypothetical protein